jgi:hypothetical protein
VFFAALREIFMLGCEQPLMEIPTKNAYFVTLSAAKGLWSLPPDASLRSA